MFKKTLLLAAVLSIILACNLQAEQIHSTWVGGESGLWENENNWDPPIEPHNNELQTFAVTISGDVKVGRLYDSYFFIDQLDSYGNVVLLENWNQENPDLLVPVVLTLQGPNGLRNHGNLSVRIGMQMRIYGKLDNPNGCTIVADRNVEIEAGELENSGLITIPPMTNLSVSHQLHNVGQINVYGGQCIGMEVFDNDSTGSINGCGGIVLHTLFDNKGKIYAFGGPLVVFSIGAFTNSGIISNAPLASVNVMHVGVPSDTSNFGTIEVNAGGGVAFDCNNLNNEPTGIIKLYGGTLAATTVTQKADANFAGFGGISSNVVIDNNGLIKLTGPTNIVGDVNISPNATLEVSDGLTLITGQTTCNGTIHIKGGYVIPQGGLTGDCNIIWEPGLYTNVTDFNLDGQVNLKDFAYFADTWLWQTAWR